MSEMERSRERADFEERFARINAAGVRVLGIRRLPETGQTVTVDGERWDLKAVTAEDLPTLARERNAILQREGVTLTHLAAGIYAGQAEDAEAQASEALASKVQVFGSYPARRGIDRGLCFSLGVFPIAEAAPGEGDGVSVVASQLAGLALHEGLRDMKS